MSSVPTGTYIAALSAVIVAQIQAQLALTSKSSGSSGIGVAITPVTTAGHQSVTFATTATTMVTLGAGGIVTPVPTLGTTPVSATPTPGAGTTGGNGLIAPGIAEGTIKFLVLNFPKKTEDEMMLEVQQGFISSTTTTLDYVQRVTGWPNL